MRIFCFIACFTVNYQEYMVEGFIFILSVVCIVYLIGYVLVCLGVSFTIVKVLLKNSYLYFTNRKFRNACRMSRDKQFFLKFHDEF